MTVYLNLALGSDLGSTTRQVLDGVEFRIKVLWLAEEPKVPFQDPEPPPLVFGEPGVWTLTLAQQDGTVILAGQLLRHGVNVLSPFRGDPRFPGLGYGELLAWDTTGNARDPGRDDLDPGDGVRLAYTPAAEAS